MRKYEFVFALVLVSAAVCTAVASATSRRDSSVLHFYEKPGETVFVDNAPKGKAPSVGDIFVSTNPVFTRHGRRIGSHHRVCTVVRAHPPVASLCTATLELPNGQLMLQSSNVRTAGAEAVVGGTGSFVGAHGLLTTHSSGQRTTIDITLE